MFSKITLKKESKDANLKYNSLKFIFKLNFKIFFRIDLQSTCYKPN